MKLTARLVLMAGCSLLSLMGISQNTKVVYILSGQGSDERIFDDITWDSLQLEVRYLPYLIPERGEQMPAYARRMATSIDTSGAFSLVGVSLGGMLCSEICTFLNPEQVIVISSAKCRSELPLRYRVQRYLPLYALVPKSLIKVGAQIAQPLVEPDRKSHKETFKAMLKAKDKRFLKRSIRMIVNWQKAVAEPGIIHIHGDNDHTLPIKKVNARHVIKDGSHMMALTRGAEISALLHQILLNP